MKVLLTGCSGFLGSHIAEELVKNNYEVYGLIRKTSKLEWIKKLPLKLVYGDLEDKNSLFEATQGKEAVIHSAGFIRGKDYTKFYEVNVEGTRNILEASLKNGVKKFIYISSQAAAGPSLGKKEKTEEEEAQPVSEYGKSKLQAEKEVLKAKDKIDVVVLRMASIYGPRDRETLLLFSYFMKGVKIYFGSGEMYFSLIYVKDAAKAVRKTLEKQVKSGSIYFVSDGIPYNLSYFYDVLSNVTGKKAITLRIPIFLLRFLSDFFKNSSFSPDKVKDIEMKYWLVSSDKVVKELEYQAEYTLKKGLWETINWYKKMGWL